MDKILTISIAAYNVEKYIEHTLSSLLIKNFNISSLSFLPSIISCIKFIYFTYADKCIILSWRLFVKHKTPSLRRFGDHRR